MYPFGLNETAERKREQAAWSNVESEPSMLLSRPAPAQSAWPRFGAGLNPLPAGRGCLIKSEWVGELWGSRSHLSFLKIEAHSFSSFPGLRYT